MQDKKINADAILKRIEDIRFDDKMAEAVNIAFSIGGMVSNVLSNELGDIPVGDDDYEAIMQFALAVTAANFVAGYLSTTGDLDHIATSAENATDVAATFGMNISGALENIFATIRDIKREAH